jgi:hypothetical protein
LVQCCVIYYLTCSLFYYQQECLLSLVLRLTVFSFFLSSDVVVTQHLASSSWFLDTGAKCIPLYGKSST